MLDIDKIYNEDCLEGMKRIDDNSIDLVVVDLPYGTTAYNWDKIIPLDKLWEQYDRICKGNASLLMFGVEPFSSCLRTSRPDIYKYDLIWQKNIATCFVHAKNRPLRKYENISVFSYGQMGHRSLLGDKRMTYNPQNLVRTEMVEKKANGKFGGLYGKRPSNVEHYVREWTNYPTDIISCSEPSRKLHPCEKPVELIEYLIQTYSNKGDLILDNCMGCGSTAHACINQSRHFVGFEINKEYFDVSIKRLNSVTPRIF